MLNEYVFESSLSCQLWKHRQSLGSIRISRSVSWDLLQRRSSRGVRRLESRWHLLGFRRRQSSHLIEALDREEGDYTPIGVLPKESHQDSSIRSWWTITCFRKSRRISHSLELHEWSELVKSTFLNCTPSASSGCRQRDCLWDHFNGHFQDTRSQCMESSIRKVSLPVLSTFAWFL